MVGFRFAAPYASNSSRAFSFAKTSFRGFRFLKKKRKPRKHLKTFQSVFCWVPKTKNAFRHIHNRCPLIINELLSISIRWNQIKN
jgi:hypothetical protein